jgi:hypothetical protein
MKNIKKAGIWMDHSKAFVMELVSDTIFESITTSEITHIGEVNLNNSEKMRNIQEQHEQSSFYKNLSEIIRNYQDIVLFGPTQAKDELLNILNLNHLFDSIKIEVVNSDKMSGIEMHKFVKDYFKK